MADYDFYVNTYLGTRIPENAFTSLAAQAASTLQSYERKYGLADGMQTSRNMAICAMAEVLQDHHRVSRYANAAVGSVSVRYEQDKEPLEKRLYRAARIYLDFYRGVN